MSTQISLFEAVSVAQNLPHNRRSDRRQRIAEAVSDAPVFVTPYQRYVLETNPYARFLRGKTLDEINSIGKPIIKELFKKKDKSAKNERKYDEFLEAEWSVQTEALEKIYRALDERFCYREEGVFTLIDKHGNPQIIEYSYDPFHFFTPTSVTPPVHHLEFRSNKPCEPNEISETGYRSHFFINVPFYEVGNFADFLIKTLRLALGVKSTIVFEGVCYEFVPSEWFKEKPKQTKKKKYCPECNGILNSWGECEDCGFFEDTE